MPSETKTTSSPVSATDAESNAKSLRPPERASSTSDGVYSVEEAIDQIGFGAFQVIVFMLCGLAWCWLSLITSCFILPSAVQSYNNCGWNITCSEEALITTVLIMGALFSNLWWGSSMDYCGRKVTLNVILIVLVSFGLLSAVPVSDSKEIGFTWLLFCRFGVGMGYGGVQQITVYQSEFFPKKSRGVFLTLIEFFFAGGLILTALLGMVVLGYFALGWRWYLFIVAIMALLSLPLYWFILPESPRYLIAKGEEEKALKVLKLIAKLNCKQIHVKKLVLAEKKEEPEPQKPLHRIDAVNLWEAGESSKQNEVAMENFVELFYKRRCNQERVCWTKRAKKSIRLLLSDGMWKTLVLTTVLWYVFDTLMIGGSLLIPLVLRSNLQCGNSENTTGCSCQGNVNCTKLENDDYLNIAWSVSSDFPSSIIAAILIELIGRKLTMAIGLTGTMAALLLLFICVSEVVTTFFLFLFRGFSIAAYLVMYTYTAEVYPTRVRGIAQSIGGLASFIGAAVTPFIAQVLFCESHYLAIGTYAGLALAAAIAALLLPIETKGKATMD